MKVFFVGIHNKPGMEPLDITTVSGKMVTAVAVQGGWLTERTNLCDIEHFPSTHHANMWAKEWHRRHSLDSDDIVVLLGAFVHNHFITHNCPAKIVKLPHPASSCYGNHKKAEWIDRAVNEINSKITSKTVK